MTVSASDNPNGRYGILNRMENHLVALIDAKNGEWPEAAIEALHGDLERFQEFRQEYAEDRDG